jgi:hypothetical protein
MESKVHILKWLRFFYFQNPPFEERTDHGKSLTFFGSHFSCEQDGHPNFKLNIDSEVLSTYRLISRKPNILRPHVIFDTTPIGRFFRAPRSVHGRIKHKGAGIWVPIDRYVLHRAACQI